MNFICIPTSSKPIRVSSTIKPIPARLGPLCDERPEEVVIEITLAGARLGPGPHSADVLCQPKPSASGFFGPNNADQPQPPKPSASGSLFGSNSADQPQPPKPSASGSLFDNGRPYNSADQPKNLISGFSGPVRVLMNQPVRAENIMILLETIYDELLELRRRCESNDAICNRLLICAANQQGSASSTTDRPHLF